MGTDQTLDKKVRDMVSAGISRTPSMRVPSVRSCTDLAGTPLSFERADQRKNHNVFWWGHIHVIKESIESVDKTGNSRRRSALRRPPDIAAVRQGAVLVEVG
jgi:hypothetical protein